MKEFEKLQTEVHDLAVAHGFWEQDREPPELLCLIHSEVSEALEAWRDGNMGNMAKELADIVIRVMDMSEHYGINLIQEIKTKHQFNRWRELLHGRKC